MPWASEIKQCRGPHCGVKIIWLRTIANKRMCVEAEPISEEDAIRDPRGVFYRDERTDRARHWSRELAGEDVGALYRSHWGSCVDRDQFRGGK